MSCEESALDTLRRFIGMGKLQCRIDECASPVTWKGPTMSQKQIAADPWSNQWAVWEVQCMDRLGEMIRWYHREAA